MNPFISHMPLNPVSDQAIVARQETIDEVFSLVSNGEYCLILGPKYSGRTTLLRSVKFRLQSKQGELPIIVRPDDLDLTGEKRFFESFTIFLEAALRNEKSWPASLKRESYGIAGNTDSINRFFDDLLGLLDHRLVLLFDSIERIPPQLLTRVANIAHSMYVERSAKPFQKNISFNFAGAIDLRYLTLSQKPEVSPFNICRSIPLRDLSITQARNFLEQINEQFDLGFRTDCIAQIVDSAGGDLNMLQRVAGVVRDASKNSAKVDTLKIQKIIESMANADSFHTEKSLQHTVRRTEAHLPTLIIVLHLLHRYSDDYRPADIDAELQGRFQITYSEMTGGLLLERFQGVPTKWRFRNKLTEMFLRHHFTSQRIARTYLELGSHDEAVQVCDVLLDNIRKEFENNIVLFNDSDLKAVLEIFTSRIYRIQPESSHEFAYTLLARLLQRGFGCSSATYYEYVEPQHKLSAATFLSGLFRNDGTEYDVTLPKNQAIPEVQAYHSQSFVNENRDGTLRIAIPLTNQIGDVSALLTIHSTSIGNTSSNLELKVHVIQRAVQTINIALSNVETSRKNHIITSLRLMKNGEPTTRVFVAHEFNKELLTNLREHLGRVSTVLDFRYVDQRIGLLLDKIIEEIRASRLCLYEMSSPNNNVYFECGLGLGLNLPGILFLRVNKSSGKTVSPKLPILLQGLACFFYPDYTGIMEDINLRVDIVLREYLANQSDPAFIHFLGCRIPKRKKRNKYVAVLDHDDFGDQRDYRRIIDEFFEEKQLKSVYPLDSHVAIDQYLTEPPGGSPSSHLIDVMELLQNADMVICRVENVKSPRVSGQPFIGLGYVFGLKQTSGFKSLPVHMTLFTKNKIIEPPADLRGRRVIHYSTAEELRNALNKVLPSSSVQSETAGL